MWGSLEIHVLSMLLSSVLVMMLIYLLVKIGLHYYSLHSPEPREKSHVNGEDLSINQFTGKAILHAPYQSLASNTSAPVYSIQNSDGEDDDDVGGE